MIRYQLVLGNKQRLLLPHQQYLEEEILALIKTKEEKTLAYLSCSTDNHEEYH